MDILSHGLWAVILVKGIFNKSKLLLAFIFGILPDLITFGLIFAQTFIFMSKSFGTSPPDFFPSYIPFLYGLTHSIIIVLLVFIIIYAIKRKVYVWMLGWPLHILIDIPTHDIEFFPTPFLWPVSNFVVDGVGWGNQYIFFPNWILIITLMVVVFRKELKKGLKRIFRKK